MSNRELRVANRGLIAAAPMLALMICAGCAKRQSTMSRPPEVNPPPAVEASAEARAEQLKELSARFAQTAERLPGRGADEHRQVMQQVFAELAQVLPVLYGPNPNGTFRQQLRIVESARTQLAAAPKGLAPEPTIDTGLRAARDALDALTRQTYFDQPQLVQTMDRLIAASDALDTTRGAMHQSTVAEVVSLMSRAVGQLSDALAQRLGGPGPETAPSTEPAPER